MAGFKNHHFAFKSCSVRILEWVPEKSRANSPVIVFVHGRYGASGTWIPLLERLAPHYRCLLLDLPGYGRSCISRAAGLSLSDNALLISKAVKEFCGDSDRAVLVGHDIGALICAIMAADYPESVHAMVQISPASWALDPRALRCGILGVMARLKLMGLMKRGDLGEEDQALLRNSWSDGNSRISMISAIKTVRETWPGPQERRHWLARLREHPTPTMILWGEKDRVNVLEPNSGWNELIPDSELFLNSDSGHWPALETPEWVEVKIREFLFRVNLQFSRSLKAVS